LSAVQAHKFRSKLFNLLLRIQRMPSQNSEVRIAIVGGGATGVELSAELRNLFLQTVRACLHVRKLPIK
jgi:NADH:ubiquinone reductase (H+-translocating)